MNKNENSISSILHSLSRLDQSLFTDSKEEDYIQEYMSVVQSVCDWRNGVTFFVDNATLGEGALSLIIFDKKSSTQLKEKIEAMVFEKNQLHAVARAISSGELSISSEDDKEQHVIFETIKTKNYLAIPIKVAESLVAVSIFFSDQKFVSSGWQPQYARICASQVAIFLNNRRSQSILSNSEKLASLGEMAGGLAHEINTPLGAILLSAGQLKDIIEGRATHDELEVEILSDILSSSEKISRIVRGLKNFSRDSSVDDFVFCNIVETVLDSLSLCDVSFVGKGIEFKKILNEKEININCNPSQISQVIVNLLNNARDAVAGTRAPWVELELSASDDFVMIRVSDSGPGIPKKIRDRLFSPFFTTKAVGHGTGLGLSISHGIVEKHHGNLILDETKKHTTFIITLPKFSN